MVPVLLQQPVAFAVIRPPAAIVAPVMGVLVLPIALAVFLIGPVIRITGQFVALPLGFASPLADPVRTVPLGFDPRIGDTKTAAMGTSKFAVHGILLEKP